MAALTSIASSWIGRAAVGVVAIAVIGAVVVAPRLGTAAPTTAIRTANVARGNVTQTVSVSGSVNPAGTTKASFGVAGRLFETLVKVGDSVKKDQPLARLDSTDLAITVKQREADLATAQARYDATAAGATPEDIALAKNSVDTAQRNLEQAQKTAQTDLATAQQTLAKVKTSYTTAKDNFSTVTGSIPGDVDTYQQNINKIYLQVLAVRGALDGLTGAEVVTARNALASAEVALQSAEAYASANVAPALSDHVSATGQAWAAVTIFDRYLADGRDTTPAIGMFQAAQAAMQTAAARLSSALDAPAGQISSASALVNTAQGSLTTASSRNDPRLDQPRLDVASILSSIISEQQLASSIRSRITQGTSTLTPIGDAIGGSYVNAVQGVQSAQDKGTTSVTSAQNSVTTAQLNFSKTTASPKQTDIASAYASLLSAQVALDKARNDLGYATLKAPTNGVVTSIAQQPGEFVAANAAAGFLVIALTDTIALHGTIGESDVAKMKLGQVATLVVDAVGASTRLTGKVTALDPVATVQQGVPVYGIDVTIDRPDPSVRPGMTGTATVIIASKQNVLTVPNLAIRTSGGQRTIQAMRDGVPTDVGQVVFGISNDTVTEVVSGLEEGDVVVLPAARTTTTTPAGGQNRGGFGGGPVIVGPGR